MALLTRSEPGAALDPDGVLVRLIVGKVTDAYTSIRQAKEGSITSAHLERVMDMQLARFGAEHVRDRVIGALSRWTLTPRRDSRRDGFLAGARSARSLAFCRAEREARKESGCTDEAHHDLRSR